MSFGTLRCQKILAFGIESLAYTATLIENKTKMCIVTHQSKSLHLKGVALVLLFYL